LGFLTYFFFHFFPHFFIVGFLLFRRRRRRIPARTARAPAPRSLRAAHKSNKPPPKTKKKKTKLKKEEKGKKKNRNIIYIFKRPPRRRLLRAGLGDGPGFRRSRWVLLNLSEPPPVFPEIVIIGSFSIFFVLFCFFLVFFLHSAESFLLRPRCRVNPLPHRALAFPLGLLFFFFPSFSPHPSPPLPRSLRSGDADAANAPGESEILEPSRRLRPEPRPPRALATARQILGSAAVPGSSR